MPTPAVTQEPGTGTIRKLAFVPGLDGLRAVAVLLVIVGHIQDSLIHGAVTVTVNGFLRGSFLGVNLFFVLSGFLITALLLQEQRARSHFSFGGFYWRRALRLLPALLTLLIIHAVYAKATGLSMHTELISARNAIVYVSNWAWKWPGLALQTSMGHLWSLALEEQFYLVWPLAVVVLSIRRNIRVVAAVMVLGIVVIMVHRYRLTDGPFFWPALYSRTDVQLDSLLVGALAAQLWVRGLVPVRALRVACWPALAVVALSVGLVRIDKPYIYLGGFTVFAVAAAVVVLTIVEDAWPVGRVLEWPPLRAIGKVSYGLYLWHVPVFFVVLRYGAGWGSWGRVAVGLSVSAAMTAGSWHLVERRALRLRHRFPRRSEAPREPVPAA